MHVIPAKPISSRENPRPSIIVSSRRALSTFYSSLGATRTPCVVELSVWQYRAVWFAILSLHVMSVVFFFTATSMFAYIFRANLESTIDLLGSKVVDLLPWAIAVNGLLFILHIGIVVMFLVSSLRHRRVILGVTRSSGQVSRQHTVASRIMSKPLTRSVSRSFSKVFGNNGLLGIEGAHFDIVLRLMGIVKVGSQTYQAWKLSHLVPTVWINRMYALLIMVSCWSSPILHKLLGHQIAIHRVLGLSLDAVSDFITLAIFPTAIFLPYQRSFDISYGDFPPTYYYDDTWYIDAIAENQQVFVTGIFDLVTKAVSPFSMLSSLFAIRGCFVLRFPRSNRVALTNTQSGDEGGRIVVRTLVPGISPRELMKSAAEKRFYRFFDVIFILWGLVVGIIHIHATVIAGISANPGCYLNLRPWLSTTYYCAVLEINCETRPLDGDAFQGFDDKRLRALILAGCSDLNIPAALQNLPQLEMLKIYNSSISSWSAQAALTGTHHPQLALLYIVRTNFSGGRLPDGLLSDDFPPSLQDIEFCVTNLEDLPLDAPLKWKSIGFFSLEATNSIQQVPRALSDLLVFRLSLSGNNISFIPDQIFANQAFGSLSLSGNPLAKLPDTIGSLSQLYRIRLEFTGLEVLPSWMLRESSVVAAQDTFIEVVDVELGGSPVCEHLGNLSTSEYFAVTCAQVTHESTAVVYPLEFEDTLRATRRAFLLEDV